jgi:hypothetical protein
MMRGRQKARSGIAIAVTCLLVPIGLGAQSPGLAILADLPRLTELAKAGDRSAIPGTKMAFERAADKIERQRMALALVRLGEPDNRYWEFLQRHAEAAVASDIPYPLKIDGQGNTVRGNEFAPEFVAWCKERGVDPAVAAREALGSHSLDVLLVAMTADPRGFDLLLRALGARNYLLVLPAAQGLARLQDPRAVRPLIEASRRVPAEIGESIGAALVFFNDPDAQAAAERSIRDKAVLDAWRERALEGPKAVFGF